ncbi:MAG: TsaB protein, required for threonylcarbamoyladenosine (t(6)A) formation in tRNA [uncultured Rubrobacteraceae bacterium]|uniref:TsaB protein, required for threonylcarbamoyladenosine (T(6)A) formation in tRNA n=1 Tax=uncultured Rubrobacteraceae bacterium TaxID=349277 RepID=A0A6J4NVN6_9ACTN|nr:MAG: TsaB protein, required for threonylcarbamoyladenosine (t(6)A) formation in tRNA [uncultured Rubrobacteraceae bacterium]
MTVQTKTVTAEELLNMPDDGTRRELVRGELREMAPAGDEHGYLALRIASRLERHVDANELGRTYTAETGFKISSNPDTVRAPDAAFVNRERVEAAGRVTGYRSGAPDLVVEVVSPNDRHSEVLDKALDWLEAGCFMVLVADPGRRTVTVYRSREDIRVLTAEAGDVVDGVDVVPRWRLSLTEIFARG